MCPTEMADSLTAHLYCHLLQCHCDSVHLKEGHPLMKVYVEKSYGYDQLIQL